MINNKLIIVVAFILVCILVLILEWYHLFRNKRKEQTKISFKEGLDLCELPIVTFNSDGKKLNFLLDTGSNISYINEKIIKDLNAQDIGASSKTTGVGGTGIETKHYNITIGYKDLKFTEEFGAMDLSQAFKAIEDESGVKLHGILGNKFFEKYKYIIDFKELIAYR
jgi:hypothetical protein